MLSGRRSNLLVFICIFSITVMTGCIYTPESSDTYNVSKGVLDLSDWDFSNNRCVDLNGQWEFYWNKILSIEDMKNTAPDLYAMVPDSWDEYMIDGQVLPGIGCATYRIHVVTSLPPHTILGLMANTFSSANNIYINNQLVSSVGRISTDPSNERGAYKPQTIFFSIPDAEFDIIVQVSNFSFSRGGFWKNMRMGSAPAVLRNHDRQISSELFLIGILSVIAVMAIAMFFYENEFKHSLYFGLSCATMVMVIDMLGNLWICRIVPGLSLKSLITIWFISADLTELFFAYYIQQLYQTKLSKAITRAYTVIVITTSLLYLVLPLTAFEYIAQVCNIIQFAVAALLVTVIIVGKGSEEKTNRWLLLLGIAAIIFCSLFDLLVRKNCLDSRFDNITYIGLLIFLLLQIIIQFRRIKKYCDSKHFAELAFLQAQIKPHFLYSTLNSFIAISRYDMEKARELILDFSQYLRRSINFKTLDQIVLLKDEIELTQYYAKIEETRFLERFSIFFDIPDEQNVKVPRLMLQPILENAINHGILSKREGGRVDVIIRREPKRVVFIVKDNGVGIMHQSNPNKGSLQSQGIAMANINRRLKKMYNETLHIKSAPEKGTEVSWSVPVNDLDI